jgi:hypothetical protein
MLSLIVAAFPARGGEPDFTRVPDFAPTSNALNGVTWEDFRGFSLSSEFFFALADRVGCAKTSLALAYPHRSDDIQRAVTNVLNAPRAYDTLQSELLDKRQLQRFCERHRPRRPAITDPVVGFRRLLDRVQSKGYGLTFVMVGGFGSHLSPDGALFESRALWEKTFLEGQPAAARDKLRISRWECSNSYGTDEFCGVELYRHFAELERTRPSGVDHRYLFWGFSKGGSTAIETMALSPEMRAKTLALVTTGTPFGGGLPSAVAIPILEKIADTQKDLGPIEAEILVRLAKRLFGQIVEPSDPLTLKWFDLFSPRMFYTAKNGWQSIRPDIRKQFLSQWLAHQDMSRQPDPVTGRAEIPVFHISGLADIASMRGVPVLTVTDSGRITPDMNSFDGNQTFELGSLPLFALHPMQDTCVSLEHSIIPKSMTPANVRTELVTLIQGDHTAMRFTPGGAFLNSSMTERIPSIPFVDTMMDYLARHL